MRSNIQDSDERLKEYRDYVSYLSKNNVDEFFGNSGEDHAREVLTSIFDTATTEVRIFAANLGSAVPNSEEYIASISNFIERGGAVSIILNKFDEEALPPDSALFKKLAHYSSIGADRKEGEKQTVVKPIIKKTDAVHRFDDKPDQEVHFTVGDSKSYRIEIDIAQRTAICNFNDSNKKIVGRLITLFDDDFANHSTLIPF